jgi:hypothetical protein
LEEVLKKVDGRREKENLFYGLNILLVSDICFLMNKWEGFGGWKNQDVGVGELSPSFGNTMVSIFKGISVDARHLRRRYPGSLR